MRFSSPVVALCLACAAAPAAAQERLSSWFVGVTGALASFRGGAAEVNLGLAAQPSQAIGGALSVGRRFGAWEVGVEAGFTTTHVEVVTDGASLENRSEGLDRLRFALLAGYRLARIGSASIHARVGPVLDYWSVDGEDGRTVLGSEGRLVVSTRLGPVDVENAFGLGRTESPFESGDLPPGYVRRGLTVWSLATGLRIGL
ncbi:MAG TPA: hypothetical protein VFU46_02915 [Gemmatimonadales bacterium]|nr:hypothetical protein [Gemmatimonadales bacterium]